MSTSLEAQRRYDRQKRINKHRKRAQQRRIRAMLVRTLVVSVLVIIVAIYVIILKNQFLKMPSLVSSSKEIKEDTLSKKDDLNVNELPEIEKPDWIEINHVEVNEYSRPGEKLTAVNGIVIHYTGNPGTTAQQHQHYYGELAKTGERSASSNYVVGADGKVIECVPEDEVAYASNDRNSDTLSIECCHPDETGKFTDETYDSLVKLSAYLCAKYDLDEDEILRHYDITGKECPRYYVKNEDKWLELKEDIIKEKKKVLSK